MKSTGKVNVTHYDYSTQEVVQDGEVSLHSLARQMTLDDMVYLLDGFVNGGAGQRGFRAGEAMGKSMLETHRTLQGCLANLALGILAGMGTAEAWATDPRNERAIRAARKIRDMIENDELPLQPLI